MKVALYARVSTPLNSKKKLREGDRARQDPETQLVKLREFAAARGYEVHQVYVDRMSGKDSNRPALDAMMEDAYHRRFEVILIVRLDRIMRSIANFVTLNQMLQAYGVGLICTEQLIDTTTPAGRLQQNLLVAFAEYERDIIRERVLDGMARARAEGKQFGRPRLPDEKLSKEALRKRREREQKAGEKVTV